MKLTDQETIALLKELYQMRDSVYRKALQGELEDTSDQLDNCRDEVQTRWLQGQRQYIKRKLDEIDSAGLNLSKIGTAKTGMRHAF